MNVQALGLESSAFGVARCTTPVLNRACVSCKIRIDARHGARRRGSCTFSRRSQYRTLRSYQYCTVTKVDVPLRYSLQII